MHFLGFAEMPCRLTCFHSIDMPSTRSTGCQERVLRAKIENKKKQNLQNIRRVADKFCTHFCEMYTVPWPTTLSPSLSLILLAVYKRPCSGGLMGVIITILIENCAKYTRQ